MKPQLVLSLTLSLLCLGTGDALAQEDPCGDETGAAYGLCSAYVSMGCHTDNPDASETACSRVAANFMKITGRDLSSKFVGCPCAGVPEWNSFLESFNYCYVSIFGHLTLTDNPVSSNPQEVSTGGNALCTYRNDVTGAFVVLDTPPEESAICKQLMLDAAANRGITCQPN